MEGNGDLHPGHAVDASGAVLGCGAGAKRFIARPRLLVKARHALVPDEALDSTGETFS